VQGFKERRKAEGQGANLKKLAVEYLGYNGGHQEWPSGLCLDGFLGFSDILTTFNPQ
jgi:hypothetical protein